MLRRGDSIRFTASEAAEFRTLGIEFDGVRTQADMERAIVRWVETLKVQRPDLLKKIATEMARSQAQPLLPILQLVKPQRDGEPA
jgi:hypothetical protein